jgi:hypothetical protein
MNSREIMVMGRTSSSEADDDDEEWPEDDENDHYIPCPYCGETMLEAADYCPACERWISNEDLPPKRHPWWIVAVILVLIAAVLLSFF